MQLFSGLFSKTESIRLPSIGGAKKPNIWRRATSEKIEKHLLGAFPFAFLKDC